MSTTFSKVCSLHPGAKVIFEADTVRLCPLCEAEREISLLKEVLYERINEN